MVDRFGVIVGVGMIDVDMLLVGTKSFADNLLVVDKRLVDIAVVDNVAVDMIAIDMAVAVLVLV